MFDMFWTLSCAVMGAKVASWILTVLVDIVVAIVLAVLHRKK